MLLGKLSPYAMSGTAIAYPPTGCPRIRLVMCGTAMAYQARVPTRSADWGGVCIREGWGMGEGGRGREARGRAVSYTHLRAHETEADL
eukprot:67155-Rhodomonas_salina.2